LQAIFGQYRYDPDVDWPLMGSKAAIDLQHEIARWFGRFREEQSGLPLRLILDPALPTVLRALLGVEKARLFNC
jgi:hypothetical protein